MVALSLPLPSSPFLPPTFLLFLPSLFPCCPSSIPLPLSCPLFLILPLPHFASSSMQAQAEAKREHEGAVQLLEVGSCRRPAAAPVLGGRQGSSGRAGVDSGRCVCWGGDVGLQEGPLNAPEPWEPPPPLAYFGQGHSWAGALGSGGSSLPHCHPPPEAAFTLKYPSV